MFKATPLSIGLLYIKCSQSFYFRLSFENAQNLFTSYQHCSSSSWLQLLMGCHRPYATIFRNFYSIMIVTSQSQMRLNVNGQK